MFALAHPLTHSNLKAKDSQPTVYPQGNWLLEELPNFPPDTLTQYTHPDISHKDNKPPIHTRYMPGKGLFPQSHSLDHQSTR